MSLMDKLLGSEHRTTDDYIELELDNVDAPAYDTKFRVRFATLEERHDVIQIKDAVYDGDIVIAEILHHSTTDRTMEHISDELKQVAREVGGDIIQKDDEQLIITPGGVKISRQKLGS